MSIKKKGFTVSDRKRMKSKIYSYILFGIVGASLGFYFLEIATLAFWMIFCYVGIVGGIALSVTGIAFEILYIILFRRVEWI